MPITQTYIKQPHLDLAFMLPWTRYHLISLFVLQEEYDSHDPKGHCPVALPFLMKRKKVIEIVAACDIVCALAHSGVCAAFDRGH